MPDPNRLNRPQIVEDLLLYRISQLLSTVGGLVVRLCEGEWGITRREWRLIAWLAQQDGLQPSQLADMARLDRARTSRALGTLVDKRLVRRQARPGDGRGVTLHLTDAGRSLYERILPRVADINITLLSALSPTEVAALDDMLVRLQKQGDGMVTTIPVPKANRRLGGRRPLGSGRVGEGGR